MTPSEEYLARLCRAAFLHLWSYPSLYRDQGKPSVSGDGKELCDLLVVFGESVLIFSDKHCKLRDSESISTAWQRWYRNAILNSTKQVRGAERWLATHGDRVFLDRGCTHPLPISLPANAKFHRILTCRGTAAAVRQRFGGTGSLIVTNRTLNQCRQEPYHLGCFDHDGAMLHIFDEVGLDAVLRTLDTVADFCDYLEKRERFFRRIPSITAAGEEELLAAYMWSLASDGAGHDFVGVDDATHLMIDESFWGKWCESRQRAAYETANRVSYCWDRLIEKFAFHMVNGSQHFPVDAEIRDQEVNIRWMAREPRVRRRMLSESLLEMMNSTGPGQVRRRMLLPSHDGDPLWVLLVVPRPHDLGYGDYREFRRNFLYVHCAVAKHLHSEALDVVGIAVDPHPEEISEDVLYLDGRSWTVAEDERAKVWRTELGIFRSPTEQERSYWEFPID